MKIRDWLAAHLDANQVHKQRDVQIAGIGAIAGAVAAGLAASGAIVPWISVMPTWLVWAGGSAICALTIIARLWRKS